jgi:RNA polymerase sigma factor (sigma-70 family)
MLPDTELLRRYADEKSEAAFAELVTRYVDLVYSAALRQVGGDSHRARDVAQVVFTALARKASALTRHPVLAGWLYTATQHAALKAVRTEARRHAREQEAFAMHTTPDPIPASEPNALDWEHVRPVLDGAMRELGERDREAVLLRFFAQRPFAEIGAALGMTEDAARMRVERALDKLHGLLARRGVTSTAAALGVALASQATLAAPVGLAGSLATAALSGATLAGGATTTTMGIIFMNKTTVVLATVAFAMSGAAVYEFNQASETSTALAAIDVEREGLRQRVQAAERRAADADQDLATLQRAVDAARAERVTAEAKATAFAARVDATRAELSTLQNSALMDYLGSPVSAPANLDPRYMPENLKQAFNQMTKTAGLEVQKLQVDNSEYPFLVYGAIAGRQEVDAIKAAIGTNPGYKYSGSVSMRTYDGGQPTTYFALNMIPDGKGGEAADRRVMLRLKMLSEQAKAR